MRILTLHRPWAWAIVHAGKNIENRQRNLAGSYRGPIAIHAGMQIDESVDGYEHPMMGLVYPPCPQSGPEHNRYTCTWCTEIEPQRHAHAGHILGVVDLVDVHSRSHSRTGQPHCNFEGLCSPWAETHALHLVLEQPRALSEPIPYRGGQGLRRLDAETIARIEAAIAA